MRILFSFIRGLKNIAQQLSALDFGKIILIFSLFLAPSIAISDELLPEEKAAIKYIKEGKYDLAYEQLKKVDLEKNPATNLQIGLLLGSGVLSTGQDNCGAILAIENYMFKYKNRETEDYMLDILSVPMASSLDYLYGGDWVALAALEGQPAALYLMGKRKFYEIEKSSNPTYDASSLEAAKEAYGYFYNSAQLGFRPARSFQDTMEIMFRMKIKLDHKKLQTKMQFKQIICPVREVAG